MRYKVKRFQPIVTGLKWIGLLGLLWLFYLKFYDDQKSSASDLISFFRVFVHDQYSLFPWLILLVIINWLSDTYVWYTAVKSIQKSSFIRVLKINLISQYMGLLVPFGIGEYGGKTQLFNDLQQKKKSLVITLSYRISKALSKWIIALLTLVYMSITGDLNIPSLFIIIPIGISIALIFKSEIIFRWILSHSFFKQDTELNEHLGTTHLSIYKTILPASAKFLSYCIQFAAIIYFTQQSEFNAALFSGILLYTASSFLPQASFFDPILKGGVGMLINPYGLSEQSILLATTLVWLLNVGIPGLMGAIISFNIKPPKDLQ